MTKYSRNHLFNLPCSGGEGTPNFVHLKSIILRSSKIEPRPINLPDLKGKKKLDLNPRFMDLYEKN